jgi:YVTN family beta-propeller protein
MFKKISIESTLLGFALVSLSITSCNKEDNPEINNSSTGPYHDGVFITNEGSYLGNNGSISFYSYSEDTAFGIEADTVYNDIFTQVNGFELGDVVQSVSLYDSLAFIVVNNSNKVEVVTYADFVEKDYINEVNQPRYLVVKGTTAYISAWGDGGVVYVVDLTTFSVTASIKVGNGPEKMLIEGDKLYVANSGGLLSDSTISIIDMNLNKVIDSIVVGGNPKAIVKDKNGSKWVLCYGIVEYNPVDYSISRETPSLLAKLDNNDEVVNTIQIAETQHPSTFDINPAGDTLYFGGGYSLSGIKSFAINTTEASFNEIVSDMAYGFMVAPKNGELFVFLAPTFTDNGLMKRFSSNGTFIKSYTVGIGPNGGAAAKNAKLK